MSIVSSALNQAMKVERLAKLRLVAEKALSPATKIAHRYGPEILVGTGIVGGVTAAVFAARATLKLEPVIDDMREKLAVINEYKKVTDENEHEENYPTQKFVRDKTRVYLQGTGRIAKLYGPALTLGVVSVGCILGAHGIMRKRNVALAAAYKAVEHSFNEYRKRFAKEFGEEKALDFDRGFFDEESKDKETGKTKVVTHVNKNNHSPYSRFFDENSRYYMQTKEYNLAFLTHTQNFFNDLLWARGYVYLNEVYEALDIPQTKAGNAVGWSLNSKMGDKQVDFGIFDIESERARSFVNGWERAILLNFNVDGLIEPNIDDI